MLFIETSIPTIPESLNANLLKKIITWNIFDEGLYISFPRQFFSEFLKFSFKNVQQGLF